MATPLMEKIVKLYKTIAQNPSLNGTHILEVSSKGVSVQSSWTQRNLERRLNQSFVQTYVLNANLETLSKSFPLDTTTELSYALTDDQERKAVLRQATVENTTKQFIEIWDKQRLIKNYDLAALDVHGDVYTDSEFGSFKWSPDKTKILYIAEKKCEKPEPFYKQKSLDKKTNDEKDEDDNTRDHPIPGTEHDFKPDWGEQLVGKNHPVVVVLDTTADSIVTFREIPDDLSPGQVFWMKDGKGIIGAAWKHEPRHLGLVACTNRLSWIFTVKNGTYQTLSEDGCAVRSPRLSPNGKYLVWLERVAGGPHHNAHRLMCLDLETEGHKVDVLIDIVQHTKIINNGKEFTGIYGRLPERCWSNDSSYLFFSTPQKNNVRSYVLNIVSKTITEISSDTRSLSILDVKNDVIAFLETSLLHPSRFALGYFTPETLTNGIVTRTFITNPTQISELQDFMYEFNEYNYDTDEEIKQFNFIYFGPRNGEPKSVPLVVVPHGGPHSNFANAFSLDYSLFALMGLAVIQVNYRGSTGMGAKNVEYLQGKIGSIDVKDCVTATKQALEKYPWLDLNRIGLCGGSHGGFLVAHLSAQHADLYKAVVARNPVIDIAAMYTISDIPDCRNALTKEENLTFHQYMCAAEVNYPYEDVNTSKVNSVDLFVKMLTCSPIVHVNNVKAPTLLCIGKKDLRVPPSQGRLWYYRLKANNVKTRMLMYDDNHPLSTGTAEIDNVINACLWLIEHMPCVCINQE